MWRQVDRKTKLMLAFRVIAVLFPQYGYIHADEFFQSTEITAGDLLKSNSFRPWEFNTSRPIRCAAFVHLYSLLPFTLLRLSGVNSLYLRLILPRLVTCLFSFIVDAVVFRLGGSFSLQVVTTSYIALTYFTRTFSNVTETILFSILLLMSTGGSSSRVLGSKDLQTDTVDASRLPTGTVASDVSKKCANATKTERALTTVTENESKDENNETQISAKDKKVGNTSETKVCQVIRVSHESSELFYAIVLAAGVFNRPTFICYALIPIIYRFYTTSFIGFVGQCFKLAFLGLPACCVFILIDSIYYGGLNRLLSHPLDALVVTPINFLLYNSDATNLARHGLHPYWLHLIVNIPLLFGAHSLLVYCDLYRLARRGRYSFSSKQKFWLYCIATPLLLLSAFPHQEPRFLLPLLVPFALMHGQKIFRSSKPSCLWYLFNILLFIFYAFLHQAAVVRMQMQSLGEGKVIFYQTYMPPRHLNVAAENGYQVIDLKEATTDILEGALRRYQKGFLIYPSATENTVSKALQNVICRIDYNTSMWPHVSTEHCGIVWRNCRLNPACLFFDSMRLCRVGFRCESVL